MRPEDRLEPEHARRLDRRGEGEAALEVYEQHRLRWLQYGSGTIQSLIDLDAPHTLALPYTQALMTCLVFHTPVSALMLGLGGGVCARFLLRQVPALRLEAVDSDPRVPEIAEQHFGLRPGPRLGIVVEDARVAAARPAPAADLIVVDVFEPTGLPGWARRPHLFHSCRGRLAAPGVLVANLWVEDDDEFLTVMAGIREVFAGRTLVLPVSGYRNLAVFAFNRPAPDLGLARLYGNARALRARTGIDFPAQVDRLRECNLVADGCLVP